MLTIDSTTLELEPSDVSRRITINSTQFNPVTLRVGDNTLGFRAGNFIDVFNAGHAEIVIEAIGGSVLYDERQAILPTYILDRSQEIRLMRIYFDTAGTPDGWIIVPKFPILNDIRDVDANSPSAGQVLTFNGVFWVADSLPPTAGLPPTQIITYNNNFNLGTFNGHNFSQWSISELVITGPRIADIDPVNSDHIFLLESGIFEIKILAKLQSNMATLPQNLTVFGILLDSSAGAHNILGPNPTYNSRTSSTNENLNVVDFGGGVSHDGGRIITWNETFILEGSRENIINLHLFAFNHTHSSDNYSPYVIMKITKIGEQIHF